MVRGRGAGKRCRHMGARSSSGERGARSLSAGLVATPIGPPSYNKGCIANVTQRVAERGSGCKAYSYVASLRDKYGI